MRLIDADNLTERLRKHVCGICHDYKDKVCSDFGCDVGINVVEDFIKSEITVDTVPAVCAKWNGFTFQRYCGRDSEGEPIYQESTTYICSNCKMSTRIWTNYCPDCGAKME